MLGRWLDAWIPRLLKLLGLAGVGLSIYLATKDAFDPVLFGGSLTAASGGFVADIASTLRKPVGNDQ